MAHDAQHERELREEWQRAHEDRHLRDEYAVKLARTEIDRRLDSMNELREQIAKERGLYMTREMYDTEHGRLRESLDTRLKTLENKDSNLQGKLIATGGLLGLILSLLAVLLHYWK